MKKNRLVYRDGHVITVKSDELVPGDIVLLEAGDVVPADLRLLEANSLKIEEAHSSFLPQTSPLQWLKWQLLTFYPIGLSFVLKAFPFLVRLLACQQKEVTILEGTDIGIGDRINMAYSNSNQIVLRQFLLGHQLMNHLERFLY